MAKLTGIQIAAMRERGFLTIEPFDLSQINPNSYNVRLGYELMYLDQDMLDLHKQPREHRFPLRPEGFCLRKGNVYLGATVEIIGSDKYVPIIDGRSTCGRYGLSVHVTAGFGDVGFLGTFTLELEARHRDIFVRPGDMIAQVSFDTVEGPLMQYAGSYSGHPGPKGPKPLTY